ncbi:unnamed protein product [Linum tenue]|uniref:Uncharacterized protein n=1 Tax=Linum tenue TaxID=586396 RepID=A0AAV0L2K1_9ROSI|nr:unnamed protein product [Linum tenue]
MIISFSVSIRSISFPLLPLIFYFFPYLIFFLETEHRPKNSSDDAPDSPQIDDFGFGRGQKGRGTRRRQRRYTTDEKDGENLDEFFSFLGCGFTQGKIE